MRAINRAGEKRINELQELFTGQWGKLMESLVKGDLIKVLNARNIPVNDVISRRYGRKNNEHYEFDLIARNGLEVVVVEVKTTLRPNNVSHFINKLNKIKQWLPEYKDNVIYGAIAWLDEQSEASIMAEKRGLINIQIVGRGMKPRPRPKGRELRLSPFGIPHRLVPAASYGEFLD